VYACQTHETVTVNGNEVGGFFLGDGTGVGAYMTVPRSMPWIKLQGRRVTACRSPGRPPHVQTDDADH
jgi:hypothetical protein